jgi:hypothetical protein
VAPRGLVVVALAVMVLVGCGGGQPPRVGMTRADEAVLGPALASEPPRAATDPRALARQITAAEAAVRDRDTPPELVAAAGRTAQAGYLVLIGKPDWDAAVLPDVPAPLQGTVRRTISAGREPRAMSSRAPTTVPAWRIVEPLAVPQLRGLLRRGAATFRRAMVGACSSASGRDPDGADRRTVHRRAHRARCSSWRARGRAMASAAMYGTPATRSSARRRPGLRWGRCRTRHRPVLIQQRHSLRPCGAPLRCTDAG